MPSRRNSGRRTATGWPLAWHLGLLCAALLLPVLALETFLLGSIATAERARHEASARDTARRIAVALDRGLATLGAVAEVLATSDHLMAGNLGAFRQRVLQLPRPAEVEVVVRDAAGRVLLDTGQAAPRERDLAAERAARATGRTQFTGALRGSAPSDWDFAAITPVPDMDGMDDRLLSLRVPVTELRDLLLRENVPANLVATIIDRSGLILARTRDAERLVGRKANIAMAPDEQRGWRRAVDEDGSPVVLAFATSAVTGWTAQVFIPEAAFAAPLRQSLLATATVALLLTGLAVLLALSFSRRIAQPLSALADAAASGAEPATDTRVQEVNALAAAYARSRAEARRLRDAQAELRHVARLNEMGALSAALAHEINQPLTAASTFAEAALRLLPDKPERREELRAAREAMEEAAEQAVHAGAILRRLRDFLAASAGDRRPASLNRIVQEAASLALADARERRIALRFNLAPDLPPVRVDRIQVAQVVVNLVRNAVEAIGDGPRRDLVVSTRLLPTREIEVAVSDTGGGIAPDVAERLFSPFVTTKPAGMGIGLAISRDIVQEHGGQLTFEPNSGGGSVFRFTLPAHIAMPRPTAEEPPDAG